MMYNGATKTEIHRAVRERFSIEWRQCDRYIAWLKCEGTVRAIRSSAPNPAPVALSAPIQYWLEQPHGGTES
jgi:hypothetical protein